MEQNEEMYTRKFKFELAQYHQCIPYPGREMEFITVQLANHRLKEIADGQSIQEIAAEDLRDAKLYQKYKLVEK